MAGDMFCDELLSQISFNAIESQSSMAHPLNQLSFVFEWSFVEALVA